MNRFILAGLAVALGIGAAAPRAGAQGSMLTGFQIGVTAGAALPTGNFGDVVNTGYNVALAVGIMPMLIPLGVRLEAAYNQFSLKLGSGGNENIPAFTGNLVYSFPSVSFSPYAIGGAGLYRRNIGPDAGVSTGDNHLGFNLGGGIKIPLSSSFETLLEARYNRLNLDSGSITFVPITVGVLF